ncbi:hypothetical protein CFC21_064311 [Triticum aestivum]|uniref:Uncharacterized protein n=2 Tax=Triticum aestivum TaxID=4565 RepID=A0A9R1KK17_WHEAT|nr:hypothetical protein CFC21_064311 [Triticum aestivum]
MASATASPCTIEPRRCGSLHGAITDQRRRGEASNPGGLEGDGMGHWSILGDQSLIKVVSALSSGEFCAPARFDLGITDNRDVGDAGGVRGLLRSPPGSAGRGLMRRAAPTGARRLAAQHRLEFEPHRLRSWSHLADRRRALPLDQ